MKIKNILCSFMLVCFASLFFVGATVPVFEFGVQGLAVTAASQSEKFVYTDLFDGKGDYAVSKNELKAAINSNQIFKFFGYEWRVVYVNDDQNVATFWMADPFATSTFNQPTDSYLGIAKNGSNIYANGYSGSVWHSNDGDVVLAESQVRTFLNEQAQKLLNNEAYANYVNKVVKGSVYKTNDEQISSTIETMVYARSSLDESGYDDADEKNVLTANYGLGKDAVLWLPSYEELTEKWNVNADVLRWTKTTNNDGYAWLRSPAQQNSLYATCVCAKPNSKGSLFSDVKIKINAGVRPAIHMNIGELDPIASAVKNQGWFNEDWLKILFIVVCVLGILGVATVTLAVILKSRQKK